MKTLKIKELGIEVTKPIEWTKPYNQIEVPKGWRKIKVWELWFILDGSQYIDEFLGDFKGKRNWFWCEQTDYAKKNNYSSGLYLYWGLYVGSGYVGLANSVGDGRVVFVKDWVNK